ncbi:uncharacterized protein A1O5_03363 [Cladophialophora psammophila CBS 110553]|uniref:Uncharacterized protein n=1 Tax=Cladophialophora psammophila CBS 110553 TaxID=1182543 RepID=W9X9I7_9EURO|nr:uncharacterized protein A1O5_03363 [Cladophialophora psammophila CBS 110553]EXJ73601.1 hypothetical protein A1O5_03363 [Cladophialophora psammophila CBS 110553]
MRHLRSVMELISSVATEHEKRLYSDAHAWLYYLGAFEERRKMPALSSSSRDWRASTDAVGRNGEAQAPWFQHRLAEHVQQQQQQEQSLRGSGSGSSRAVDPPPLPPGSSPSYRRWPVYRRVFRTFFLSDWAQPHGSTWFDRVVASQAEVSAD